MKTQNNLLPLRLYFLTKKHIITYSSHMNSFKINFLLFLFSLFTLGACDSLSTKKASKEAQKETPCYAQKKISTKEYKRISDSIHAKEKNLKIYEYYSKLFKRQGFNGCIYIQQAGIDIFKNCSGDDCPTCDIKQHNSAQTSFQLASLSKTFTAVAVLKLYDEKKIGLDDDVKKYYPNFPYDNITIRLLLSHRSGLPNYMYAFDKKYKTNYDFPNNQKIMQWFEEEKPGIYYFPDRKFAYNNSNYVILAAIVETVSGLTFNDYMKKNIFEPLKLKNTYVMPHVPDTLGITRGFEGRTQIKKDYFDEVAGDKGIYSSIDDLFTWYKSLSNNCILSKETTAEAFSPQSSKSWWSRNYGLGFRMLMDKEDNSVKHIYHNGWWKGYNSVFWFCPETETFIVILCNVKNKSIYRLKPIIKILENSATDDEDEVQEEDLES